MLEQLRAAWSNLQPGRRWTVAATLAATVVALALVGYWSSRPSYSLLYGGLAPEDAAAVVEELRSGGVPYRLGARGGSVEVPTRVLYETRLRLASQGMPSHGAVGFELFDRSSLPGTDFSNAVNLQRALQGELSRTIASVAEVRSARVHLSLPRESLYADPTPPSASVLLDLGNRGALRPEQIRGIAYLVASGVENLSHHNVTVVDALGNVLHGGGGDRVDLSDSALATARAFSEALSIRLQTMLDAMFGPYRTIVRAQAELDMDAEETSEEIVEPVPEELGSAVSRERTAEESYDGAAGEAGAVAGVPAAVMGREGGEAREREGSYRSTDQTREFEFSRRTSLRRRQPGRVTRLTVAAVVDESLAGLGVERVREVLAAAAGVDPMRGDTIVVRPMKLKAAELAEQEEKLAEVTRLAHERQAALDTIMHRGAPIVIMLLLLAIVARTAAGLRRAAGGGHEDYGPPEGRPDDESAGPISVEATREEFSADRREEEEERELTEELRKLARERPDVLAEELRNLVNSQDNL